MGSSKRFVVASFFAAITISVLCNSIYGVIVDCLQSGLQIAAILKLAYSFSLMLFLIKYFIDDVVDDEIKEFEKTTRRSLASLIIGWTLLLLSSLFAQDISASAAFWTVGMIFITRFLYNNRHLIPHHAWLYLTQNIVLLLLLALIAISYPNVIVKAPFQLPCSAFVQRTAVALLFASNVSFFLHQLSDDS